MRKKLSKTTDSYAIRYGVSFAIESLDKLDALARIAGMNRSRFLEKIVESLPDPHESVPSSVEVYAPESTNKTVNNGA